MEQVNCKFGAADAAAGQACGALELNFPAAPTCFFPGWRRNFRKSFLDKGQKFPRSFSKSVHFASLLRRRIGMPGFGAAAAAPRQACGTPELNFPSAPTCFFPGLRRILALRRILRKNPGTLPPQNPPCKTSTSPAKFCTFSAVFSLHFFSFLRISPQGSEFLQISPVFLPKPQSLPLLYWAQLKDEPPAGAPSDETSPAKIQVITTYRKQEVTHELLR